jgi:hypothetical protein
MSRPLTIACDGCGKQKQASNRWWTITQHTTPGHLTIRPGSTEYADPLPGTYFDFCGQTCALKWVSEQMGKVTS